MLDEIARTLQSFSVYFAQKSNPTKKCAPKEQKNFVKTCVFLGFVIIYSYIYIIIIEYMSGSRESGALDVFHARIFKER